MHPCWLCAYAVVWLCAYAVVLRAGSEFVVSIISDWFVEAANHTCGNFPPEVDEMKVAGLTPVKSIIVTPPRVKESAMNMECKVCSCRYCSSQSWWYIPRCFSHRAAPPSGPMSTRIYICAIPKIGYLFNVVYL